MQLIQIKTYINTITMHVNLGTLDYSVFVEPHLDINCFYRKEEEFENPKDNKRERERGPIPFSPAESLGVLIKYTGLRHLRMYYSYKSIYLYLPKYRFYSKITAEDLSVIVSRIFCKLSLPARFMSNTYLDNVVRCAFVNSNVSYLGNPQVHIEDYLVAVSNGVLNIRTGKLIEAPSPELFVVDYLPFAYDPNMQTPCFDSYLSHISEGVEEKKRFIRATLNVVIRGEPELHFFIYIFGVAGAGKTTLTLLANALVGDASTHTTTLRALNSDQFEAINIEDKKLIIIGDTENYTKDVSQLKALTGGDPVRGRIMYSNSTRDTYLKGTLIMTGNALLNIRDNSGALHRRIRPYKMTRVPEVKENLLSKDRKGGWNGSLASELPGILHFAVSTPREDVDKYLKDFHKVEALREGLEEAADMFNPLRIYVQEALEVGEGAFLGLKPKGEKETRDFSSRFMLYPTYIDFQYRRGLHQSVNHNTFTTLLMSACEELGIKVEKLKKPSGTYIKGVIVRPNYHNPDIAAGGPLDPLDIDMEPPTTHSHYPTLEPVVKRNEISSTASNSITSNLDIEPTTSVTLNKSSTPVVKGEKEAEINSSSCNNDSPQENAHVAATVSRFKASPSIISHPGEPKQLDKPLNRINAEARQKRYFTTSEPQYVDPALSPSFIDDYHEALSRHSTKQSHANRVLMELSPSKAVDEIMGSFEVSPKPSDNFLAGVRDQVVRGVEKLNKFGGIPKTYKQMGISPRITPLRYGDSINSTKKLVRNYGYRLAASVFKEYGFSIVDVDLRSAYTSVLLGLYPHELQRLRVILRNTNLWDSIKEDYRKAERLSYYDKPSVKVCVYASLFGGGKKAMFDSILENKRKAAGMTAKEFKGDEMFEVTYQLASMTTDFMLRHPIVQDFNDLSKALLNSYKGCWLQGPSGHKYQICESSFRNVFPCFLQSYEFALLAGSTLELIKQFPKVEVIGHYHDGNVLAVPTADLEEILKALKDKVASLGQNMKLSFPIEIEVQEVFDPK